MYCDTHLNTHTTIINMLYNSCEIYYKKYDVMTFYVQFEEKNINILREPIKTHKP